MLLADLVSKTRTFPLIFIKFILFFQPPFTLLINFLLRSITIFGSWWVKIREYSAQTVFVKGNLTLDSLLPGNNVNHYNSDGLFLSYDPLVHCVKKNLKNIPE